MKKTRQVTKKVDDVSRSFNRLLAIVLLAFAGLLFASSVFATVPYEGGSGDGYDMDTGSLLVISIARLPPAPLITPQPAPW